MQQAMEESGTSHPDPAAVAREAGLRYVTDEGPGIQRRRRGRGFTYLGVNGEPIQDAKVRQRIESLAIPPAWTEVWICPSPKGHLQATGRDEKGRKQYRYHPLWRDRRNESKFGRMVAFGSVLPAIRERVAQDMKLPGLPREKVVATVVALLEKTLIRVGNREYARRNKHYGLTTLHDRHVSVRGSTVSFQFRGKSGKRHFIDIKDSQLARVVKKCQDIPGHDLFQYMDEAGICHNVSSHDVNGYLRQITDEDFTAKDFRTWAGTVLAAAILRGCEPCSSESEAKRQVSRAVKAVAEHLGNTPAVCRQYYIHPAVLDCYARGTLVELLDQPVTEAPDGLDPDEVAALSLLRGLTAHP